MPFYDNYKRFLKTAQRGKPYLITNSKEQRTRSGIVWITDKRGFFFFFFASDAVQRNFALRSTSRASKQTKQEPGLLPIDPAEHPTAEYLGEEKAG